MADKMERWTVEQRGEYNDRVRAKAISVCYAINPSNPMAVAEGLEDIIKACRAAQDYFIQYDIHNKVISGLSLQLNEALAAITKPAIDEEKGD